VAQPFWPALLFSLDFVGPAFEAAFPFAMSRWHYALSVLSGILLTPSAQASRQHPNQNTNGNPYPNRIPRTEKREEKMDLLPQPANSDLQKTPPPRWPAAARDNLKQRNAICACATVEITHRSGAPPPPTVSFAWAMSSPALPHREVLITLPLHFCRRARFIFVASRRRFAVASFTAESSPACDTDSTLPISADPKGCYQTPRRTEMVAPSAPPAPVRSPCADPKITVVPGAIP